MFVQTEIGKAPNQLCRYTRERHEELAQRYGFQTFQPADRAMVDRYSAESIFFDLSFTNFWAWDLIFHYRWRMVGDTLTIVYINLDRRPVAILMPGPSRRLGEAMALVREMFREAAYSAVFAYVPEMWLPLFQGAGARVECSFDRDWSDYVYRVPDFVNLEGGENKSKRRELKLFEAQGSVEFRSLGPDSFADMLEVFDRWCGWHACEDCYFGCERNAFARIGEIWDPARYYGGLVYLDGEAVAFALGETLGNCACYSFQKNVKNYRGLTYYLSYHCAMLPGHPPALNWCEDMGLEGLRINKLRYRPSAIVNKYMVTIRP